jgi:hypothetical protein
MKRHIFLVFLIPLILIISCNGEKEWISLFNGEDLSGWVVKAKPEDQGKNFWFVNDGYIEANSLGRGDHDYIWLYTEKEYGDFEIKYQFQAFRESPGNSGIQVRSRYDEDTYWLNGPQIDIHPPGFWRSGMMWDETRGNQRWIFPDIPDGEWVDSTMAIADHDLYFEEDEVWNEMRVKARGTKIEAWLNGHKITDYEGAGTLDNTLHKNLNVGEKGHIALQIHTGDELKIRFKDIYIKELFD